MNHLSTKIILKTQSNSDGTSTVYLRLTFERVVKYFNLGIKVFPKDWNEKYTKKVKTTDKEHNYKNEIIINAENKAKEIVLKYYKTEEELTIDKFTDEFLKSNKAKTIDFFEFTTKELEKKVLASETRRTYKSEISKLKQFRNELNYKDITVEFYNSYLKYMVEVLHNESNTFAKSTNILKRFLDWAVVEKVIKQNPLKDIKTVSHEGNRKHLNNTELINLENLFKSDNLNANQKQILTYFLFTCYTGLRYQDVVNLKKSNFYKENIENETVYFIRFEMNKVKKEVTVPIIPKAFELVELDKKTTNETIFKTKCNQLTNRILKETIKLAGIEKNITFHCGRHTFATLGYAKKIRIEVISKMLGHANIKTTMIYTKITEDIKYDEMKKMN